MSEEELNKITWEEYKRLIEESEITYNELQETTKEIERQSKMLINRDKELLKFDDELEKANKEIKRLNNIINEILTFGIYKEECPMTLDFEDNCLEGKAQKDFDIYMNCDEHCGCGLEDNHNECWLKYFERLQELKGSDKE